MTFTGANIVEVHENRFEGTSTGPAPLTNDPQLGPLQYNEGPGMSTMAIDATSPASNAAAGCPPPAEDERGVARTSPCDLGAFELPEADADGDDVTDPQDNCPFRANPGQEDTGGIASNQPDGVGNACQCGEVTGEGEVNGQDGMFITRHGLGYTDALFVEPGNCDVTGNGLCNGQDGFFVTRAALGYQDPPHLAPSAQNCQNADPLAPPCTNC